MQPLLSDSPFGVITCKAGNRICSSLTAENPLTSTRFCDLCCSEPGFCGDCCCILCGKLIVLDYDGYSYIRCEATVVDGHICGHVSHLECALRSYMAGTVKGSINLNAEYLCRYCDSRTDLVPHALKLLSICTSVASYADIKKILNLGIRILCHSQKSSAKELLDRIKPINAKLVKGVGIQDALKRENCGDSTEQLAADRWSRIRPPVLMTLVAGLLSYRRFPLLIAEVIKIVPIRLGWHVHLLCDSSCDHGR
uniref:Oberon-like PHD finger domain-containing protein n=1 Tax=Solanum lycopersicum TaxID=4081 RepID=K4C6A3_SOLLC